MLNKAYQQGNTFLPFLALIAIAILVSANIWLYFNVQKEIPTQQPLATQPTTTTDEINNWQTYTNDEFNFSFKYPPQGWTVEEMDDQVWLEPTGEWCNPTCYTGFNVELTTTTINNFIQEYNESSLYAEILEKKPYTLNGISGTRIIASTEIGIDVHYFFFEKDKKTYILSYYDALKPLEEEILSTFRFIDYMSDWQAYRSEDSKFEFNYPSIVTVKKANAVGQFSQPDGQSYQQYWDGVYIDYTNNYTNNPSGEDISLSIWSTDISADEFQRLYDSDDDPYSSISSQENITFAGHPAILITAGQAIGIDRNYIFPKGIPLVIDYYNGSITKRILSTFKLIK